MAVGAGLSSSFGIAPETTPGTPVAVTRFVELESSTLKAAKKTVQGAGFRQGGQTMRAVRRSLVARTAGGDVMFDPTTNGFGLFLQYMLGSSATPTLLSGNLYQQIHNIGPLTGKSFTTQIVKPDTTGVLTQQAYTYPGCKITDWELSTKADEQLQLKLTITAMDEATPSNGFASTVLSAAVAAGATTISTTATIPVGAYVTIDTGLLAEVVQTNAVSGVGPYVSTLTTATKQAHVAGVYVGSATGLNYGAGTALQAASYSTTATEFNYTQGSLISGGTTATTAGVFTNTGGTTVGNVRSLTIVGKNPLAVNRKQLGSMLINEQIDNGWREYSADVEVEFNSRAQYDAYMADAATALQISFTGPGGAKLSIYAPAAFQEDGAGQPEISNGDIILLKQKYVFLDDGVNGTIQVVYTSTDTAL